MQLVVPDHVDEVTPANDPARGAQMSRTVGPGRLLHVQVAQLAELEWRKLLRCRALPLHGGSMPASATKRNTPTRASAQHKPGTTSPYVCGREAPRPLPPSLDSSTEPGEESRLPLWTNSKSGGGCRYAWKARVVSSSKQSRGRKLVQHEHLEADVGVDQQLSVVSDHRPAQGARHHVLERLRHHSLEGHAHQADCPPCPASVSVRSTVVSESRTTVTTNPSSST